MQVIRGVLFDLSGVLYVGDAAVPGAVDALGRLRSARVPVRFVTNVSRTPSSLILERLWAMGFTVGREDLYTAPVAAREHLRAGNFRPHLLVHADIFAEFDGLATEPANAVLVGDAEDGFTYASLNRAFRVLLDGVPLFALGNNRYFRAADGLSLDVGAFVAALEYASGTPATVLGKPAPAFFAAPLAGMGCDPGGAVMVGVDVDADVNGALAAGLGGILVRTGKYRRGDEDRLDSSRAVVVNDVVAAVEWILERA